MSKIDPANSKDLTKKVAKDKEKLKKSFTYRSLDQDMDRVFADTDRPLFAEAHRAGQALYGVAAEFVLDCYYEQGALEPLVHAYSGQPYRVAERFDRLLQQLRAAKRDDLIERFWSSITRLTRAEFFFQRPRRDHGDQAGAGEYKNHALEAYEQAIAWMNRLGRREAADRLSEERDALRAERLPPLPAATDRRRIDEPVFWDLVSATRSGAVATLEQMAVLGESLRVFEAPEIKRFGALYAKFMRKLYHWGRLGARLRRPRRLLRRGVRRIPNMGDPARRPQAGRAGRQRSGPGRRESPARSRSAGGNAAAADRGGVPVTEGRSARSGSDRSRESQR